MREPTLRKRATINPFTGEEMRNGGAGLKGFAAMKENEVGLLENNALGIELVYIVDDKLKGSRKGAMCANGGWCYVWEYTPDASVYFVPANEPDIFDEDDRMNHIKIGRLAYASDENRLGLLVTLSQDAVDILLLLGDIYDSADMSWTEFE